MQHPTRPTDDSQPESQREVSARATAVWHTFPGARTRPLRAGTWPGEPGTTTRAARSKAFFA